MGEEAARGPMQVARAAAYGRCVTTPTQPGFPDESNAANRCRTRRICRHSTPVGCNIYRGAEPNYQLMRPVYQVARISEPNAMRYQANAANECLLT